MQQYINCNKVNKKTSFIAFNITQIERGERDGESETERKRERGGERERVRERERDSRSGGRSD